MVINLIHSRERRCDRCGATAKEALLTKSHSPHTKLLLIASMPLIEREKLKRIYTLCESCRRVHHQLEHQMLAKACADIAKLHEDYLNQ